MKLTHDQHRHRGRVKKALTLAVAVAGVALLVPGGGPAQAQSPQHEAIQNQITTHDSNQTSQHNSLSGQVSAHDTAQTSQHNTHDGNQTSQHNSLSGQITTHDSAQTTEHNALSQKIDNLSTSADHSGLPPTWDKTMPANDPGGACPANSSRFKCVMGNAAVRDNETGLVWEKVPDATFRVWDGARSHCVNKIVGGRKGWRLPSVAELASLVDPSVAFPGPTLPPNHPFSNVVGSQYWSASSDAGAATDAWVVVFVNGNVLSTVKSAALHNAWCVRGAMNADQF
jgi:hypothetical protein